MNKTLKKKKINARKIKRALAESQNMLKLIINSIPQHIFWKDINSVFIGCNKNFANAVGLESPKEIVGKTDFDLTSKEKAEHFIKIDQKVFETNMPLLNMIECHKNSDGELIWVKINKIPLKDLENKTIGILGSFENITTEINLQDKLKHNEEKYRSLINTTNTAYIILDINLKILETNENFTELMGCKSIDEITGRNPRCWVMGEDIDKFDKSFETLLSQGNVINDLEIKIANEKNVITHISLNANIIENGGKKIFCLVRNISQRIKKEEIRHISEQKEKDQFLQNIRAIRNSLFKIK